MFSMEHTFSRVHVCIYNVAKELKIEWTGDWFGCNLYCYITWENVPIATDNFLTENQTSVKAPLANSWVSMLKLGQFKKITRAYSNGNVLQTNNVPVGILREFKYFNNANLLRVLQCKIFHKRWS